MVYKKLEKFTYECQIGMYFSGIKKLENGFIVYLNTIEEQGWNFFTGFKAKSIEEFETVYNAEKQVFKGLKREPCFVLTPSTKVSKKVKDYIISQYSNFSTSVTLLTKSFFAKKDLRQDYSYRRINNQMEKELFVNTFKTSRTQTLHGDTYHALSEYYFEALRNSFSSNSNWKFIHYVSLYKNEPIGMCSACVTGNYCGL